MESTVLIEFINIHKYITSFYREIIDLFIQKRFILNNDLRIILRITQYITFVNRRNELHETIKNLHKYNVDFLKFISVNTYYKIYFFLCNKLTPLYHMVHRRMRTSLKNPFALKFCLFFQKLAAPDNNHV